MNSAPGTRRRKPSAKKTVAVIEAHPEQSVVAYDESLLERTRTQWQFGDWESLSRLDRESLQHHPDRAKLSLLAAAGYLQVDLPNEAKQCLRLAEDWGCNKKLIAQILAAGVHNNLGRAAVLAGQQARAFKHFEFAIATGMPGTDTRLLAQARISQQLKLLGQQVPPHGQVQAPDKPIAKPDQPVTSLVNINFRLGNSPVIKLGFNSSGKTCLKIEQDVVEYETEKGAPLYLVSNEDGNFEKAPLGMQVPVVPDTAYLISGEIAHTGENRPVIWVFQYAGGKKIDAQSINTEGGRFQKNFRTMPAMETIAVGIRLAGKGSLNLKSTALSLQERTSQELIAYFEEKIEKIKLAQKHEVESSMKQLEACVRLQHYLGPETILPDMHNWPISPDFGVLLINMVEHEHYDLVIEFGSGTSTLILAKALEREGRREGRKPSPFLSFDHLQEYAEKTEKLLVQAGLTECANVVLAPLAPWQDDNGDQFSYYACDEALHAFRSALPAVACKLLVIVDGPPAATGSHARYPALPKILAAFPGKFVIHFLLDDYIRVDEQEIAARWLDTLSASKLPYTRTEFNSLEKKACLIEVRPATTGDSE